MKSEKTKKSNSPRALLVSIQLDGMDKEELEHSLAELARLVQTLGFTVAESILQKKHSLDPATLLGEGKVQELAEYLEKDREAHEDDSRGNKEGKIEKVIFDLDLGPRQAMKLEKALGVEVTDRRGVIIEIFSRHAKTREARLQVEIAKLNYQAPRIREQGKGGQDSIARAGESGVELDKRKVRDRIVEIKKELKNIAQSENEKRKKRQDTQTVALVGYTNAGKSSMMRALTEQNVYVADKLFATLDTKVRALSPKTTPPIYVIDTVGFIKKLPHDLVASFRSTLEEAQDASLLLFVVDASDADFRQQLQTTQEVLKDIGIENYESAIVLNKIDRVTKKQREGLAKEFPKALQLSALDPSDVAQLRLFIIKHFEKKMPEKEFFIPHTQGGVLAKFHELTHVLEAKHGEEGTTLRVRGPEDVLKKLAVNLKPSKRRAV